MADILLSELGDYFDSVIQRRFSFGGLDCCTFMADWMILRGLPDAMADRRGTYFTKREYRVAIRSERGLVQSCRKRFAAIGMRETAFVSEGDVALILAPIGRRRCGSLAWAATGSIAVSEKLRAVVTPDLGLVVAPAHTIMAWTINA